MTPEFYQKTTALYDEFQKRELHYLNMDKTFSSSIPWKKNSSELLQDYLSKINKREKETEETYETLMKQMEELDKRTEMMALKLEKLDVLKNSIMSSPASSWPVTDNTYSKSLQLYMPSDIFNTDLGLHSPIFKLNVQSICTQTENIYCEQCNSLISVNAVPSFQTIVKSNSNEGQILHSLSKADREYDKKASFENIDEHESNNTFSAVPKKLVINPQFANVVRSSISEPVLDTNQLNECTEEEKLLHSSTECKEQSVSAGHAGKLPIINDKKYSSNIGDLQNVIGTVSTKSDDESINNEFDFLESGKRNSTNKIQSPDQDNFMVSEKEPQADHEHAFSMKSSASVVEEQNPSTTVNLGSGNFSGESTKLETNKKSNKINEVTDSSISITGPHSPSVHSENLSVASDSDSIFEKEIPLTATAAYQAMIGKTVLNERKIKKQVISNSESEDEVENALANAVRKASTIPLEASNKLQQDEGKKDTLRQTESKATSKVSKPSAVNKPSKLSKNTRKVLGLDTSSGSEMEVEVKPNVNNNPEDSDEFDFYN